MSIGERIKLARISCGLTQQELADAIGCSVGTISRVETNPQAALGDIYLHKAANVLKHREAWLSSGLGRPRSPSQQQISTTTELSVAPLFGFDQAIRIDEMLEDFHLNTDAEIVYLTRRYSDRTYALTVPPVIGGSQFPNKSIIVVDPDETPENGNYIVAVMANEKNASIKQFIIDGDRQYFASVSSQLPAIEVRPGSIICGVIKELIVRF